MARLKMAAVGAWSAWKPLKDRNVREEVKRECSDNYEYLNNREAETKWGSWCRREGML